MIRKKVILINPPSDCVDDDRLEPPLGLLYIFSVLRSNGIENIELHDLSGCSYETEISEKIAKIPLGDIYGISTITPNYKFVKRIIGKINQINPKAISVLGGPHASGLPEITLNDSGATAIVIGEGEDEFLKIVLNYEKKWGNKIFWGNGRRDIDSYPFPARDIIDFSTYSRVLSGKPSVSIISSRGCRNNCIFCASLIMGGGSRNVRFRSAKNILLEISSIRDQFSSFRFNDDNFLGNKSIEDLLIRLKEYDIKYRIFCKVEDLSKRLCRILKESGCVHVSVGLESLNPDNLQIVGKESQIGTETNLAFAVENGIVVRAFFIVGLPYDTDKTIEKYFSMVANLGINEFSIFPLIPYPGTQIWKHPDKYGYKIINKDFSEYIQLGKGGRSCFALEHNNFTSLDVKKWVKRGTEILNGRGIIRSSNSKVAQ